MVLKELCALQSSNFVHTVQGYLRQRGADIPHNHMSPLATIGQTWSTVAQVSLFPVKAAEHSEL